MSPVLLALAPVFGLVLFGYGLRRINFPGDGFWPVSERLTYYVLFPALLLSGLSGRQFDGGALGLAAVLFGAVCLVAVGLWGLRSKLGMSGPAFSSMFQGAIRPNTYVGLSAAAAFLGPDWMTLSAAALLTLVPLVNVLCVLVLARCGDGDGGVGRVLIELARNPLILACVGGIALNWLGWRLPDAIHSWLATLGQAALPLGLLAVGAGLRFAEIGQRFRPTAVASLAHLVVLPLAAWTLSWPLGLDPTARTAALIYTAIPVSVSAFILARQMGGDHKAMAVIITVQTMLSAATLPLILWTLGG